MFITESYITESKEKCTLELQVRYGDISSGSEVIDNLFPSLY